MSKALNSNTAAWEILYALALDGVPGDASFDRRVADGMAAEETAGQCEEYRVRPLQPVGVRSKAVDLDNMRPAMDASGLLLEAEKLLLQEWPQTSVAERTSSFGDGLSRVMGPNAATWSLNELQGLSGPTESSFPGATAAATERDVPRSPFYPLKAGRPSEMLTEMNESSAVQGSSKMKNVTSPDASGAACWHFYEDHVGGLEQTQRQEGKTHAETLCMEPGSHDGTSAAISYGDSWNHNYRRGEGVHVEHEHSTSKADLRNLLTATPTVHCNPQTHAGHEHLTDFFSFHPLSRNVMQKWDDGHDDEKDAAIRDKFLRVKEARCLQRAQRMPHGETCHGSAVPNAMMGLFHQHLNALRSVHHEATAELEEAVQLLLQERKWITMRCTILYDRLQQINHHRTTMMDRLRTVHGDLSTAFSAGMRLEV
ncbi:hypothetical protein MOQ_010046 [Trypanosoma cruzi marinkellei]|uniref:Uncharacterized protein n=1 Tax=Trypanosoma cruzi marinkellei TaxID=85056 RepID=K2MKL7_TRYCR|nr:hypothetical protein MOQ_010046 [Trypanosoma cruzi marinkellei]